LHTALNLILGLMIILGPPWLWDMVDPAVQEGLCHNGSALAASSQAAAPPEKPDIPPRLPP
jgi:hypothetical protein